jgi:hypothetical protein
MQTVLARRIGIAAWRLARADRMEAELLEFRSYEGASPGLALIRDANGTRSIETLVRYRNAAMAEFTRAVRTLQALQAGNGERDARARDTCRTEGTQKGAQLQDVDLAHGSCRGHAAGAPGGRSHPSLPGAVPRRADPTRPRAPRRRYRPRWPDEPETGPASEDLIQPCGNRGSVRKFS